MALGHRRSPHDPRRRRRIHLPPTVVVGSTGGAVGRPQVPVRRLLLRLRVPVRWLVSAGDRRCRSGGCCCGCGCRSGGWCRRAIAGAGPAVAVAAAGAGPVVGVGGRPCVPVRRVAQGWVAGGSGPASARRRGSGAAYARPMSDGDGARPGRITLAGSAVAIEPLGVGTWAWGDKATWGMGGYDTRPHRGHHPRGVGRVASTPA